MRADATYVTAPEIGALTQPVWMLIPVIDPAFLPMFPGKCAKPTPKMARGGCCAHLAGMMTLICLDAFLCAPACKALCARSATPSMGGTAGPFSLPYFEGRGVVSGESKSPKTLTRLAKRTLTRLRILRDGKNLEGSPGELAQLALPRYPFHEHACARMFLCGCAPVSWTRDPETPVPSAPCRSHPLRRFGTAGRRGADRLPLNQARLVLAQANALLRKRSRLPPSNL